MASGEIDNVTIDYFTVTATNNNGGSLWIPASKIVETLGLSLQQKPWRFFGYQGLIFSHKNMGHFAYGEASMDIMGVIVQASGEYANRFIDNFMNDHTRWSRVDLTVDVMLKEPEPTYLNVTYDWIVKNGIKTRKYSLIQDAFGGTTLYVGSRQSEEFGRVYDKGAELGLELPLGSKWRYEIELKGQKAKVAIEKLKILGSTGRNRTGTIATTVNDWFVHRDVVPLFARDKAMGLDLRLQASTPNEDQKLLWLRKQVAPTVKEFLSSNRREVLDALGITEFYRLYRKPDSVVQNLDSSLTEED